MASKPLVQRLHVLRRRIDFLALMKNGQRVRPSEWLLMNFAPNTDGQMRCGWTLPRHVGSAVIRNRLKRWSRIYFRNLVKSNLSVAIDVNLVFRKAEPDFYRKLNYEAFSQVLDRGWKQVGRRIKIDHEHRE